MNKSKEFNDCVKSYNMPLAKTLLKDGFVDIDSNYQGETILITAAIKGSVEFVNWAINNHADVNLGYIPPLHRAAQFGHLDCVKALVKANAHIGCTDRNVSAALFALEKGHFEIFEYLNSLNPEETFKIGKDECHFYFGDKLQMMSNLLNFNMQEYNYLYKLYLKDILKLIENGIYPKKFILTKKQREFRERIAQKISTLRTNEKQFFLRAFLYR